MTREEVCRDCAHAAVAQAHAGAYPGAVVVKGVHAAVADAAVVCSQPLPRAAPLAEAPREWPLVPRQHPPAQGFLVMELEGIPCEGRPQTLLMHAMHMQLSGAKGEGGSH
jgi:hypothetical protein